MGKSEIKKRLIDSVATVPITLILGVQSEVTRDCILRSQLLGSYIQTWEGGSMYYASTTQAPYRAERDESLYAKSEHDAEEERQGEGGIPGYSFLAPMLHDHLRPLQSVVL